jgi:hypothetical protein
VAIEAPGEALAKNERGGGRRRSRKNNANKRNTRRKYTRHAISGSVLLAAEDMMYRMGTIIY